MRSRLDDILTRLLLQADAEAEATSAAAAAVDSSCAAAGTSGSLVELSVKWNKQDIVIHVEPDESVQVGRPCGASQAANAGRAGRWSLHVHLPPQRGAMAAPR